MQLLGLGLLCEEKKRTLSEVGEFQKGSNGILALYRRYFVKKAHPSVQIPCAAVQAASLQYSSVHVQTRPTPGRSFNSFNKAKGIEKNKEGMKIRFSVNSQI
jgi:hypothetical protein